jgi:GntP family gluconate:H+ symporter
VPPHPGPLIGIDALHADLGKTMLYGFIIAIPTVIIAGPVFAHFATHWAHADPPQALIDQVAKESTNENPPPVSLVIITILLPVVIMLGRTVVDVGTADGSTAHKWADFIGDPIIALGIGLIFAMFTLGSRADSAATRSTRSWARVSRPPWRWARRPSRSTSRC